jgi:hypothetical protein
MPVTCRHLQPSRATLAGRVNSRGSAARRARSPRRTACRWRRTASVDPKAMARPCAPHMTDAERSRDFVHEKPASHSAISAVPIAAVQGTPWTMCDHIDTIPRSGPHHRGRPDRARRCQPRRRPSEHHYCDRKEIVTVPDWTGPSFRDLAPTPCRSAGRDVVGVDQGVTRHNPADCRHGRFNSRCSTARRPGRPTIVY